MESWNYVVICWSKESLVDFSICFYFGAVVSDNKYFITIYGHAVPLVDTLRDPKDMIGTINAGVPLP